MLITVIVVAVAVYAAWYINKTYSTPLKSTFVKKVEPKVEVKVEVTPVVEPIVEKVKKPRKPRAKKTTKKKGL